MHATNLFEVDLHKPWNDLWYCNTVTKKHLFPHQERAGVNAPVISLLYAVPGRRSLHWFYCRRNCHRHCHCQRAQGSHPLQCLGYLVILCFEKRCLHKYRTRQFFGGGEFFSGFPQTCPKRICATFAPKFSPTKIMKIFFWCGLQTEVFTCFSANVGSHFCPDFQRLCPDFQRFCLDFRQIKTFGVALV